LRAGDDKGRIYRIYPADTQLRKVPRLDRLDAKELAKAMDSPNGWQRDTAQRLLVEMQDKRAAASLQELLLKSARPKVRLQALATLDGLHALSPELLLKALEDSHSAVRRHAILLSERVFESSAALRRKVLSLVDDPDIRVRYQLAFSLGEWKEKEVGTALTALSLKEWQDKDMQVAIMSSVMGHAREMLKLVLAKSKADRTPTGLLGKLVESAAAETNERGMVELLEEVAGPREPPPQSLHAGNHEADVNSTAKEEALAGLLDAFEARKLSLGMVVKKAGEKTEALSSGLRLIFEQARRTATNAASAEPDRLLAIGLLGRGLAEREQELEEAGSLLVAQNPENIQNGALVALRKDGHKRAGQIILDHWKTCGPGLRQEMLSALLSRTEWAEMLLGRIGDKTMTAAELGTAAQQKLLKHSSEPVRKRAAELLAVTSSDRQKVIESYKTVSELKGNRERGHALFVQSCSVCHRFKDEGKAVGPDLGTVAGKPVQELVVAILDPNQAVDPAYASYSVVTKDDRDLTGILAAETPNSILLRMTGGTEETVLRNNIQEFRNSGRSLMPEGFETALKAQDMADLITYISGGP